MKRRTTDILPGLLFIAACGLIYVYDEKVLALATHMELTGGAGHAIYVLLLVLAVVLMPLTVMPLIPMAAAVFGPFMTGVLSVLGWTIGGIIAFLIARHLGRPLLRHLVNIEKIDSFVREIPENGRFLVIVLLRLTMPVDIVSYGLGLSKEIRFWQYTLATLVGVSWFSFAFAYLGDAMFTGNTILLIEVGAVSLLVFVVAFWLLRRHQNRRNHQNQ